MSLITKNKKAYFDYEVMEVFEAWLELKGHEVKSIRSKQVNLKWSYIVWQNGELFVKNMHISPWKTLADKNIKTSEIVRKVFLHKKHIIRLTWKLKEKWLSLLPLELYFKWSLIKLKIWLAKWKKAYQKKQILKERTLDKEASKLLQKNY